MCSWRRSLKIFSQVSNIMNYFEDSFECKYIFLTLTVKNVSSCLLVNELDKNLRIFQMVGLGV